MRFEQLPDEQLNKMREIAQKTVLEIDEKATRTFDLDLLDEIDVPVKLISDIDRVLDRREMRTSGARAVGDSRNYHKWSEDLLAEAEQLRKDFLAVPFPGEKND